MSTIISTCIFCQFRSLRNNISSSKFRTWQPSRSMAQVQRRRPPSRMELSPRVSQALERRLPSGKPIRKSRNSPFGGMNMREPNMTRAPDKRSQAELKRSTGGRTWSQDKEERGSTETYRALKMQRSLSPISYKQRGSVKERISEIDTFEAFDILPVVKESISTQALPGLEEVIPTPVQRIVIPAILGQDMDRRRRSPITKTSGIEEFLIAAETGSGKTLAYLLPVLDAIKRAEALDNETEDRNSSILRQRRNDDPHYIQPPPLTNAPHPTTGRPRAIILLPTSELVSQVGTLAKSLSHTVKFRSSQISSANTATVIRNRLFSPAGIDLLICTPHLLSSIATSDPNILSRTTHLVIDEADSLLDRSFAPITSEIIDKCTPSLQQLILCAATIPRSLDSYLRTRFPDLRRLVTPNLHAIPRRVQLGVVDVERDPYRNNKLLACADTIYAIGKAAAEHSSTHAGDTEPDRTEVKRILVFVNEREKTVQVADYLQSKGIDAVALSRDTPEQRHGELLASFTSLVPQTSANPNSTPPSSSQPTAMSTPTPHAPSTSPARKPLPNTKVLVTTDLGSRGIDTLAVRHVILYDVPHSTIDFIHRLGRTGRMGRRGRGIVLVGKGDRRDVVREVREGMFRGQALI